MQLFPKIDVLGGMANGVEPNRTAPSDLVCTVCISHFAKNFGI